jgi:hypothetical protein
MAGPGHPHRPPTAHSSRERMPLGYRGGRLWAARRGVACGSGVRKVVGSYQDAVQRTATHHTTPHHTTPPTAVGVMKSEKRALVEMAIPVPVVTIAEATAEDVAERVARGDVTGAAAGATTNAEMMADLGATGIEVALRGRGRDQRHRGGTPGGYDRGFTSHRRSRLHSASRDRSEHQRTGGAECEHRMRR